MTTRALVVCPDLTRESNGAVCAVPRRDARRRSAWRGPSISTSWAAETMALGAIRPATYLGKGKVEAIAARVKGEAIDLVVMDCALSPVQQRNLEKAFGCKVIDRTGLILEIFGQQSAHRRGRAAGRARASRNTSARAWCAHGPTSSGSAAASVFSAAPARPRSRPTGA